MPRNEEVKFYCRKDEVGFPLSYIIAIDGVAQNLTGHTLTFAMFETDSSEGVEKVAETATGISIQPTQAVTYDSTVGKLKCNQHGLERGYEVIFANSGGSLPTGLSAGVRYFCRDVTEHYFNVCLEPDTTKITISGAGTGTHTFFIVGHVQYSPQSGDLDTVGTYYAWFYDEDAGGNKTSFPRSKYQNNGGGIIVEVE